jgi:PTS system beta-glucosides-specific IIC component
MTEPDLARSLLDLVGGVANIRQLTHCMVRLRFTLNDPALADDAALGALPDVLVVVRQSGQLQLALRVPVIQAYRDVRRMLDALGGTGLQ